MHFSFERLKSSRERADLTQQDLADKSGVSLRSIVKWEQGEGEPRPDKLRALCTVLPDDYAHFWVADIEPEPLDRLSEVPGESELAIWKRRAKLAEKQFHDLKTLIQSALEMSSSTPAEPNVKETDISSSETREILKRAEGGGVSAQKPTHPPGTK